MDQKGEHIGLTTKDALSKLCKEIENTISQYQTSHKIKRTRSWLYNTFNHSSQHSNINWISITFLLVCSLSLILAYLYDNNLTLVLESLIIVVLSLTGISLEIFDNYSRTQEITQRATNLINRVRQQIDYIKWDGCNYPYLFTPFSPCITLQWTYRDDKIVNLPWALLVKDDVVIMRPGQLSPGFCEAIDRTCGDFNLLHAREVYGPTLQNANEIFSVPKSRKPLENKRYKLLETPYLDNLRLALEQGMDRPVTPHNKQRHLLMIIVIERILLPIVSALIFLINIVRFTYLEAPIKHTVTDLFILVPIATIIPLLPIVFPITWNIFNYVGLARLKTFFDGMLSLQKDVDTFDEQELMTQTILIDYKTLWNNLLDVIFGRSFMLARTANILHILGSVTALCCVDKKGILSWPNPTAEKVFILHNAQNASESSSLANLNDLNIDGDGSKENTPDSPQINNDDSLSATVEVLDVTYNPNDPFKLHFDDTKWHKHLNSLKPLGLAILLNTCNVDTQEHYTQFCSHITCEAMYNENLIPVTNRRCLCELAKEIGFVEQAQKIFSLEQQLSTFRHLQPEMVRRDNKYARSLSMSTKLKFPFPHMFAVAVKELSSGSMQLLCQGTADIILDSCVDYWDGYDLCPLTPSDRKKIQDFYQRSSLTAYCTAFAYRPLSKAISDKLSRVYLELPSDSRHLYNCHRSPTPVHWDCRSVLEPRIRTPLGPFYSTDSLLYNDTPTSEVSDAESCFDMQCNQVLIGLVTMQYQAQADMVRLIEELERACIRFVHFSKENELRSRVFSEKMGLESGWNCHISLLSERNRQGATAGADGEAVTAASYLRRRALRRKSQSDRRLYSFDTPTNEFKNILDSNLESSRTMSFSAPSAINMEQTVVRFDMENQPLIKYNVSDISSGGDINKNNDDNATDKDNDSMHAQAVDLNKEPHDWQSLSCLTDSTEQSVPINFDMSNRAKLPRGIDKIRPHIELIDNVPLLVSLFTDCTPSSTKEMLHIMQDYGEVVCVLGSSSNTENIGIFLQADASIAIEPIYPQMCQKHETYKEPNADCGFMSPIELSRALNSIPCSFSFKREEPIAIYHLVMEARSFMWNLWNSVQFWISCCISLSFIQLTAAVFMLPAILTVGQVLWLVCFLIPLLSISLIGNKVDCEIMKKPQAKNQIVFNAEVASFVLWCYGSKFLPLLFVVLITFAGTLASYCIDVCAKQNCTCVFFYLPIQKANSSSIIGGWIDPIEHNFALNYAQNMSLIVIVLHFVVISIGFVHREHNLWTRSPHTNNFWLIVIVTLLMLQAIFSTISLRDLLFKDGNFNVNGILIAFVFLSPILTLFINEIIKREEIKVIVRQHKRIRLEFGTKLGMNSPF